MKSVNIPGYQQYFRTMAVQHKFLQHDPNSETKDSDIGKKHFARWSADEVLTGLRTKLGWPALLLELYEVIYSEQNKYDIKGNYHGAFSVLDKAKSTDYTSEIAAFAKAEQIVMDILQKIWQDHYGPDADACQTPFFSFDFNNLQIMPVGPLYDNNFGWRVEFKFVPQTVFDVTQPPAAGTFIFPAP